jgi:XTP/dITP diphosphohydrolase
MRKLLIATRNKDKLPEITAELLGVPFTIIGLDDVPEIPINFKPNENGKTFKENAIIKAKIYGKMSRLITLADDSGLCVDALDGRPGVYSARYTSGGANIGNNKILNELKGIPKKNRSARYVDVIAIYDPERNKLFTCEGICEGAITQKPKGTNGFAYDPIFFSFELGKTTAEASREEKNSISHRGRATRKAREILIREFTI